MKTLFRILPIALIAFAFTACDDADPIVDPVPVQALTVTDLAADPIVGFDTTTGQPVGTGAFTFYSLRENRVVANTDSATAAWDLGFRGTEIIVNGGVSGPGEGAAQVLTASFDDVTEAPEDGYATDTADGNAVPTGSGNGWYNYNGQLNLVTPIPGRVIVLQTADGRYAKVRINSYYRGAPANPDSSTDEARYYSFDYVFQPDGSRSFEN